ncbi:MAG: HlyD family efflux transporter periplasmic adaptor subunit [Natronospirillum sp.]|uniref:HlyD family efflux transporter periplasmic adaptor subunit n=1 Tax=Natronospirillum sp. TaxID=2812955 RepID=UPI0025F8D117|nr:HlyD family efflux transporter periplasmic adaptor subunit [Natronospirillum sp.]MCH8551679.1 HlyD family efflux transporter periplasmic adaptor subunit [Natronospirillum sp.]
MTGLFRQEAIVQQQDRLHGDVLLLQPLSIRLFCVVALLFVSAVAAYLSWATFPRKETVQGHLVPSSGVLQVTAPRAGIVRQVLVSDGDRVSAGQPLFVVNGDSILADGRNLETLLLEEYQQRQSLLSQRIDRVPTLFAHRRQDVEQSLDEAADDLESLRRQASTLEQRLALTHEQVERLERLRERNLASQTDLNQAVDQRLALESELQSLQRSIDNQRHQRERLQAQLHNLITEQEDQQDQLHSELSTLAQQIAELHGRRAYVITAERDGRITSVQAVEGQDAEPGLPLASLLPEDTELLAELFVPTSAIGFLETGQPVRTRYSAFPYQQFGLYDGQISEISNHVLLPSELHRAPIALEEPVYRVRARIDQQHVLAFGQETPLKPGILLEADIELADRTLVQWLMEPIFSIRGRL